MEPPDVSERDQRLDEVLSSYFEALEAGSAPDLTELLARHPDLALGLAEFFADEDTIKRWTAPFRPAAQAALARACAGAVAAAPWAPRLAPVPSATTNSWRRSAGAAWPSSSRPDSGA